MFGPKKKSNHTTAVMHKGSYWTTSAAQQINDAGSRNSLARTMHRGEDESDRRGSVNFAFRGKMVEIDVGKDGDNLNGLKSLSTATQLEGRLEAQRQERERRNSETQIFDEYETESERINRAAFQAYVAGSEPRLRVSGGNTRVEQVKQTAGAGQRVQQLPHQRLQLPLRNGNMKTNYNASGASYNFRSSGVNISIS